MRLRPASPQDWLFHARHRSALIVVVGLILPFKLQTLNDRLTGAANLDASPNVPRYKANSIFTFGKNAGMNACIGTNGGPYDYGAFAEGFFDSADYVVDGLRDGIGRPILIDLCVYPVVANYRHGLELLIKHCIIMARQVRGLSPDVKLNHDLGALWADLLKLEKQFDGGLMTAADRKMVSEILTDFAAADPIGMLFRYPEDKMRRVQIDSFGHLNLDILQGAMEQVKRALTDTQFYLESLAESAGVSIYSVGRVLDAVYSW